MNWAGLALAIIQLAIGLLEWSKRRSTVMQVQQEEAARQALRLLDLTERGRQLRSRIEKLEDQEATSLWEEMIKR